MTKRPVYVGVGECDCQRVNAPLYCVLDTAFAVRPACPACLAAQGYTVEPLVHAGKMDLGHEHYFEAVLGTDDQLVGWLHTHPDARNSKGMLCQSFCAIRVLDDAPVHQVVCDDPLTLTPSLLCRTCGAHGYVRNGKWEPV